MEIRNSYRTATERVHYFTERLSKRRDRGRVRVRILQRERCMKAVSAREMVAFYNVAVSWWNGKTSPVSGTSRRVAFLETVTRVMESLITHTQTFTHTIATLFQ